MSSMGVGATLFLLFIATVNAEDGKVEFWRTTVTMTCPEKGDWFNKANKKVCNNSKTYDFTYENAKKGTYYCQNDDIRYYFYVQGKACDYCFELEPILVGCVIIFDIVLTTVLMMVTYKCTKKKSSPAVSHTSRAPIFTGGTTPTASSPYESLNPHTRSQDPYSEVHRMG